MTEYTTSNGSVTYVSHDECVVKGCSNTAVQGEFHSITIAAGLQRMICSPCLTMLMEGKITPSEAWFAKDIARLNLENLAFRKKLLDHEEEELNGWCGWVNR